MHDYAREMSPHSSVQGGFLHTCRDVEGQKDVNEISNHKPPRASLFHPRRESYPHFMDPLTSGSRTVQRYEQQPQPYGTIPKELMGMCMCVWEVLIFQVIHYLHAYGAGPQNIVFGAGVF